MHVVQRQRALDSCPLYLTPKQHNLRKLHQNLSDVFLVRQWSECRVKLTHDFEKVVHVRN